MNDREIMKKLMEANGVGSHAPVLRPQVKESMAILADMPKTQIDPKSDLEGNALKCVLITEGLGNRNNLNYYGPEAIESGPAVFEGKPCFIDHISESEAQNLPERSVKAKCGYFKNVHVEHIDGRKGLVGEIHFDLSESGQQAYQKALTALHYKAEFPSLDSEYVGLSIAANGEREARRMVVEGETLNVHYVKKFTEAMSCDIVTMPARGGRFVALVESAAGAILRRKESHMVVEKLKAAHTALSEALKDKDLAPETKKSLKEASASVQILMQEAMEAAEEKVDPEKPAEEPKPEPAKESKGKECAEDMESEDPKKAKKKKKDDADADDDAQESRRGYITSLLKEAGIPEKVWNIDRLMKLSLKEAKADIGEKQALLESAIEARSKEMEFIPVGSGAESLSESAGSETLNGIFAGLAD